jgi:hypothetical protein
VADTYATGGAGGTFVVDPFSTPGRSGKAGDQGVPGPGGTTAARDSARFPTSSAEAWMRTSVIGLVFFAPVREGGGSLRCRWPDT